VALLDARIAQAGGRQRQTVLLSATLHSRLDALASLSLRDPLPIGLKTQVRQG
jgi:superfamily II DNA/RNA helicase